MKQRLIILLGGLVVALMVALLPEVSQGVPSFSRQIQKPCTACHTVWPTLNQYGRQFKVKAYTDISPEWKMEKKDGLNLPYILPLSVRVTSFLYTQEDNNQGGVHQDSTRIPDQIDLFLASRVFDYMGVFTHGAFSPGTNAAWTLPVLKMAFQYPLPLGEGNTIGLVAFKGSTSSADPFNSLGGRDRLLTWGDETVPWALRKGWTFNFFDEGNVGVVAHGYFLGNRLYAAVGGNRGGRSEDVSGGTLLNAPAGADVAETNPIGGYFRLAWDQKLPNGAVTFGAAYQTGRQRIIESTAPLGVPFQANVQRGYLDASLEQNFAEDHLVEAQALFGLGSENNVFGGGEERKFQGLHLAANYFYQRKYGIAVAYNLINTTGVSATDITGNVDSINAWVVGVNYLPWANTKLAVQYAQTLTKFVGGDPDQTDNIVRVVVDLLF